MFSCWYTGIEKYENNNDLKKYFLNIYKKLDTFNNIGRDVWKFHSIIVISYPKHWLWFYCKTTPPAHSSIKSITKIVRISKISEIFWQWKIWLRFTCNYFIILSLRLVCPIVVCACASWSVSFLLDVSSSTLLSTNSNYIFRLIQCNDLQIDDFLLVYCLTFYCLILTIYWL